MNPLSRSPTHGWCTSEHGKNRLLHDSVIGACGELADTGWHPQAWTALDEIGVTALAVPEANGGAGATYADAAVVLPALGSLAASLPIVEVGLMAGWRMTLAGSQLPTGVVTAATADDIDAQPSGGGWLLTGRVPRVPWARHADRVVILTRMATGWTPWICRVSDSTSGTVSTSPANDGTASSSATRLYRTTRCIGSVMQTHSTWNSGGGARSGGH